MDDVKTVLNKAADLIEKRGLAKKILEDTDGKLCVNGAINMAVSGSSESPVDSHEYALASTAQDALGDYLYNIGLHMYHREAFMWNNKEETTQEMVLSALREAAEQYATV